MIGVFTVLSIMVLMQRTVLSNGIFQGIQLTHLIGYRVRHAKNHRD